MEVLYEISEGCKLMSAVDKSHTVYPAIMSNTEQDAGPSTAPEAQGSGEAKKPVVILCIGMAGSVSPHPLA